MIENNRFKNKIINFFRDHWALLLIMAGSFFLCLIYSFYFQITPAVDARAYDVIAQNIVNGIGFSENPQKDILHDYAIARVGPLYEYFLAGLYKIFGHHYGPVWVAQSLLHSLTVWLVYLTSLLIFINNERRKKIGLWAAAIIGFYPDLIEISAMLMTETLYLFLVCLMIYLFFSYFSRSSNWLAASLGLISGLATLARPPVLFLIPIILFYFWRQKLWRPALLFLTVLILVFTPWTARNYLTYEEIMPFGAAGNFNFWIGNYHGGNGEQGPTAEQMEFEATHKVQEINGESMRQFKVFLLNYPGEFIKLTFLRINKCFSVIRPMGWWFYQQGLGQLLFLLSSALSSVFLFVLGLAGVLKTIVTKDSKLYYFLALTVMTPLIIFITVVETRYRFQLYPLLAIFAGYFIVHLIDKSRWWADRVFLTAGTIIFANGLLDLFLSWGKFMERLKPFTNL